MDEERFKILTAACDAILIKLGATVIGIAVDWLHIVRAHPVFLQSYVQVFEKSFKSLFFLFILREIPIQVGHHLRQIYKSLLTNLFCINSDHIGTNFDIILVSHQIGAKQVNSISDHYYGDLPYQLSENGKRVLILAIDHTNLFSPYRLNIIESKNITRLILPKSLSFKQEIQIIFGMFSVALYIYRNINSNTIIERNIKHRAIFEALTYRSTRSLRISKQVEKYVANYGCRTILTPFEGHSWERMVVGLIRKKFPKVVCCVYQTAPIFRFQHGAQRALGMNYDPDYIFTNGKRSLVKLSQIWGLNVKMLGYEYYFRSNNNKMKNYINKKKGALLILPEGIDDENLLLCNFSLEFALKYPNIIVIYRAHPLIDIFKALRKIHKKTIQIPSNFIISSSPLDEDIDYSSFALYRGSSAIFEAMRMGLTPIYLSILGELAIDPLYELGQEREVVTTTQELEKIIMSESHKKFPKEYYHRTTDSYIAKLDISQLNNVLCNKGLV